MSKSELIEALKLNKDDNFMSAGKPEMTPLLMDIIDILKLNSGIKPNSVSSYVQTEEAGEAAMTLD